MPQPSKRSLYRDEIPQTTPNPHHPFQIHLFVRQRMPFQIPFILTQQGRSLREHHLQGGGLCAGLDSSESLFPPIYQIEPLRIAPGLPGTEQ
jgi:hypothetical protein